MRQEKSNPKRQHWVPECYLSAWAVPSAQGGKPGVWRIDRVTRQGQLLSLDNVCVEGHIYTRELPNGERDFKLEQMLSELEHLFDQTMREVIGPMKTLDGEDRELLAYFAGAMLARTPRQRDHVQGQWQAALEQLERMERVAKTMSPEQLRRLPSKVASGGGPSFTMEQVRALATQPVQNTLLPTMIGMGRVLSQMSIAVLISDSLEFITSDAPCVMYDPAAHTRPPFYRHVGLGYKSTEVALPLAPNRMLHFSWLAGVNGLYLEVPDHFVDEANRTTQFHADRGIVSRTNETRDIWFEERGLPADAWEHSEQAKKASAAE
jgi:Protein of unknown function (DUF4238)